MKELQQKLMLIQSRLVAKKSQRNNFGNYNYRSCEDINEALKPLLKETGTTVTTPDEIALIGDRYYVKTTAIFTDGKDEIRVTANAREPLNRKGMDEAQITGATSSYSAKYALSKMFLLDDTKDPDATNKHEKEVKKVSMPKESQSQVTDAPRNATNAPVSNDNTISQESASSLVNLAKDKGFTKQEFWEVIFTLGYNEAKDILKQDYNTIVDEFSQGVETWKARRKEIEENVKKTQEEVWNES